MKKVILFGLILMGASAQAHAQSASRILIQESSSGKATEDRACLEAQIKARSKAVALGFKVDVDCDIEYASQPDISGLGAMCFVELACLPK